MSATANSDWAVRFQFSKVPGYTHQCFATASMGFSGKTLDVQGDPPIADVRLVTGWRDTREEAQREIDALIAQYEAGVP